MSAARKIRIFEAKVKTVRLDELKVDAAVFQSREKMDYDIVNIYCAKRKGKPKQPGTPFPPVLVYKIDGVYWLADGHHRYTAAMKLGEEEIPAVIREGTMVEALIAGAEINMSKENLRGYQEADRTRYAELLIKCGVGEVGAGSWDWSHTEIGRRAGIAGGTIKKIRVRLRETEGIPIPEKLKAFKDGVWYGRWTSSRIANHGSPLRITTDIKGNLYIRGRKYGKDPVNVEHQLAETEAVRQLPARWGGTTNFHRFAANHFIHLDSISKGESLLGGRRIGPAAFLPVCVTEPKVNDITRVLGHIFVLLNAGIGIDRAVLVGNFDRLDAICSQTMRHVAHLVRVLSPAEFVAEFGGREPDAPDATADAGEEGPHDES